MINNVIVHNNDIIKTDIIVTKKEICTMITKPVFLIHISL